MTKEIKEITIGVLFLFAFILWAALSWVPEVKTAARGNYTFYNVIFDQADGLRIDDPVRISGVKVGSVTNMTLDSYFNALVTIAVQKTISLPIDSYATIYTEGLLGAKAIEIDLGMEDLFLGPMETITYTQSAMVLGDIIEKIIEEGSAKRKVEEQ